MAEAFVWTCIPAQKATHLGGMKPRGQVIAYPDTPEQEVFYVPAAVARMMAKREKDSTVNIGSRAELLYEISRCAEHCCRERLIAMIDRRDHSSAEAAQKLRLDGYSTKIIEARIQRALEVGLIDDQRFADSFIRSKLACGWGSRRIEQELRRRGVELNEVRGWPYDFIDPSDESERAYEVVCRKSIPATNAYPKLMRFLVSRGFSPSVAGDAVKRRLSEEE